MMENELELNDLDAAAIDTLELIASSATMWAKQRAQAWLSWYDGRTFSNTMLYPVYGSPRTANGQEAEAPAIAALQAEGKNYLYPNPVKEELNIVFANKQGQLQITDITGRKLLNAAPKQGNNRIDVRNLPSGIYIYRLMDGPLELQKGKIVKD